jgi:HEAT repeat protein/S1-C subfamily serine protease
MWIGIGGGAVLLAVLVVVAFLMMKDSGSGNRHEVAQAPPQRDFQPRDAAPRDPAPRDPAPRDPAPRDPAPRDNLPGVRPDVPANPLERANPGPRNPRERPEPPTRRRGSEEEEAPANRGREGNTRDRGEVADSFDLQQGAGGTSDGDGGTNVFNYVLKSAVLIFAEEASGFAIGSGSLIDKANRLVLTNHHVAGAAKDISVYFPRYDRQGKLIVEKEKFRDQFLRRIDVNKATVLASDPRRDLCLLRLQRLPAGVEALPLAKSSPQVGQRVHSVGNPATSGALWVYAPGIVRQVYHKRWRARGEENGPISEHEADIVETQSPTNHGDSGGPLVNDRGELVGVTQGGMADAGSPVSIFIEVGEVRRFTEKAVRERLQIAWTPDARPPLAGGGGSRAAMRGSLTDLVKGLESQDPRTRTRAAEALGEMGEGAKNAIPALLKLLVDPDDFTRRTALAALNKIGVPAKSDVRLLAEALNGTTPEVRRYAAGALAKMGPDARGALQELLSALNDSDAHVRQAAAQAIGGFGAEYKDRAASALEPLLGDGDHDVRIAAAAALANFYSSARDIAGMRKLMKHQDPGVRAAAAKGLAGMGRLAKPYVSELVELARQDRGELRRAVLQLLCIMEPMDAKLGADLVVDSLKAGDKDTKLAALATAVALGKDLPPAAIAHIREMLKESDCKFPAIAAIGKLGLDHKAAVAALADALKDPDPETQDAAIKVIAELGPKAVGAGLVNELVKLMDIEGDYVTRDDKARITKIAEAIAKMGRGAVPALKKELLRNKLSRWGCAIALGNIGTGAREALRELQVLAAVEPNDFIRADVEDAIRKIQGR